MNTHTLSLVLRAIRSSSSLPILRDLAAHASPPVRQRHTRALTVAAINRYAIATGPNAHVLREDDAVEVMF